MAWDKNKPGNVKLRVGRQQILTNNDALETALNRDHNFPGTPTADDGEHFKITLHAPLVVGPTAETDKGFLYLKDVSAKAELFFEDEDGHEIQLTTGGTINMAGVAFLAGEQTFTGAKTFGAALTMSGANIAMAGAETVDGVDVSAHKAGTAKAQHDGGVGDHTHESAGAEGGVLAKGAIGSLFGAWETKALNTEYVASTDGIVCLFNGTAPDWTFFYGQTPTGTSRVNAYTNGASVGASFSFPVIKGDTWKIVCTSATGGTVYWLPIGV